MCKKGFSQEALKLIACVTMLIDHIGAVLMVPTEAMYDSNLELYTSMAWINLVMHCIGRIAFPIFCFLLVEGVYHTRDPQKYIRRLAIGAVLSEIPFDLAFFRDGISWAHQSVMVTLLLYWDFSYQCRYYNLDIYLPMNRLPLLSAIPILCYNGRKLTYSRKVQWAFYLFYPAHIAVLILIFN